RRARGEHVARRGERTIRRNHLDSLVAHVCETRGIDVRCDHLGVRFQQQLDEAATDATRPLHEDASLAEVVRAECVAAARADAVEDTDRRVRCGVAGPAGGLGLAEDVRWYLP